MPRVPTYILLEDGREVDAMLWADPSRHGLWFLDASGIAGPGDYLEVGPFGSETESRVYLLARVERELGMVREVRRQVTSAG